MNIEQKNWFALVGISLLAFTAFLDFTIINAALPAIQIDLKAPVVELQWVVNAYAIANSILMILAGKFGDIYGRKKIFYLGGLLFIIAALGAGLSTDIHALIGFRALQGVACSCVFILGISLIPVLFPDKYQQHAIGVYSAITGVGMGIGPLIGGTLVALLSWRWVFFINIPIVIIGFLMSAFILPESERQSNIKIDWVGFCLLVVTVFSILFGLNIGEQQNWQHPTVALYFIVTALAFIALLIVENQKQQPLLDLTTFTRAPLLLSVTVCVMAGIVSYELFFFDPLYLSAIRQLSAFWIGLCLLAVPGAQVIISSFWGKLSSHHNIPNILTLSLFCGLAAAIMHFYFTPHTSYWFVIIAFIFIGVLWGVANSGGVGYAIQSVDPARVGATIGTLGTTWNISGSIAIAAGAVIFHNSEQSQLIKSLGQHHLDLTRTQHAHISAMLANPAGAFNILKDVSKQEAHTLLEYFRHAFMHGFQYAMLYAIIALVIGCLAALTIRSRLKTNA